MKLTATALDFRLARPFGISRGAKTEAKVIEVQAELDGHVGRGEAVPYGRYGETVESCLKQLQMLPEDINRESLLELLPAGAARNAADLAIWDLEAKISGMPVWELAGLVSPTPIPFGYTISLSSVEEMAEDAAEHSDVAVLKIKLGSEEDADKLYAIRQAAPNARLLIDVNEGWSPKQLEQMLPVIVDCKVELLEQPLPAGMETELSLVKGMVPLCADESNQGAANLEQLARNFDFVNVKLDKSGGLTAALNQISKARELGLGVMVGCMVSSSLGIAPAFLLAQLADYTDLDGFISLAEDRPNGMVVEGGKLTMSPGFWGEPV